MGFCPAENNGRRKATFITPYWRLQWRQQDKNITKWTEILSKEQAIKIICKALQDFFFCFAWFYFDLWALTSTLVSHFSSMNERNVCFSCLLYTVAIFHDTVWLNQFFFEKNLMTNWNFQNLPFDRKKVFKQRVFLWFVKFEKNNIGRFNEKVGIVVFQRYIHIAESISIHSI